MMDWAVQQACMRGMMREEEKRCRPWLVALIQKAALPTKASTQNQLYQSTTWLGHAAVMM